MSLLGVHGNIDPERTWGILQGLAYRASVVGPVAVLWLWLARRVNRSRAVEDGKPL